MNNVIIINWFFPVGGISGKKLACCYMSLTINGGGYTCMCLKAVGGEGRDRRKEEVCFQAERRYSVF